jgi:hypothetical protein
LEVHQVADLAVVLAAADSLVEVRAEVGNLFDF